jgi:hypothetical protein
MMKKTYEISLRDLCERGRTATGKATHRIKVAVKEDPGFFVDLAVTCAVGLLAGPLAQPIMSGDTRKKLVAGLRTIASRIDK